MSTQSNPEARAQFLASLEYGVNPLVGTDLYSRTDAIDTTPGDDRLRRAWAAVEAELAAAS